MKIMNNERDFYAPPISFSGADDIQEAKAELERYLQRKLAKEPVTKTVVGLADDDGRITPENRDRIMKAAADQAELYCEQRNKKQTPRSYVGETSQQRQWREEAEEFCRKRNKLQRKVN